MPLERLVEKPQMNPIAVPVVAMAAITAYVGFNHAVLYLRRGQGREDLTFAITCLVALVYDLCCVGVYSSNSVAEGVEWQRLQIASLALFGVAFMWFVSDYTGLVSRRIRLGLSGYFLISAAVGLIDRSPLTWQTTVPAVKHVSLPFGLDVTYHEAAPGPLILVQSAVGILAFVYILSLTLRMRARGQSEKALPLMVSMLLFFVGLFNDTAVGAGLYSSIYLIEYAYLSLILLMAYRLSTDLVEAGRVREALMASEEQLRQAQKMESIGRLAGGIAHDFNNLLTPILGYSAIMLERLPADDPLRENLGDIHSAAEDAADLTRQLLAFSRKQRLEMCVLDLNQVLAEFEPVLRRLIRKDIEIRFLLDPGLEATRADATQIRQIAMNLALNAQDAMPEGGLLEFETANLRIGPGEGGELDAKAGDWILLRVRDSGQGMDAETVGRLFEPFFTTKERGKGTGLGLATIHGIVNQHGGRVTVESEPGCGTCFRLLFPQTDDLPEADPGVADAAGVEGGDEAVLVVEDDPKVRNLVCDVLAGRGYRVIAANDVRDALGSLRDPGTPVDLLLCDIVMPQANGFELHAVATEIRPGLRVLFMSGHADAALAANGALGAEREILAKPFAPGDLAQRVREVLDAA